MKSSKKIMLVAAVLLLAAALFVGAGAAAANDTSRFVIGDKAYSGESWDTALAEDVAGTWTVAKVDGTVTMTLQINTEGPGIGTFVSGGSGLDGVTAIVIDLNGKTYTFTTPAVGSTGTQTQALHFEECVGVTIKNGTLNIAESNKAIQSGNRVVWLVNSYNTLNLDDVTLDGTNVNVVNNPNEHFVLHVNIGNVTISGNSKIIAPTQYTGADKVAAIGDRWYHNNYPTTTPPALTISDTAEITGDIVYGIYVPKSDYSPEKGVPKLTIEDDPTINGDLVVQEDLVDKAKADSKIGITGDNFTVSSPAAKALIEKFSNGSVTPVIGKQANTTLKLDLGEIYVLDIPSGLSFTKDDEGKYSVSYDAGVTDAFIAPEHQVGVTVSSSNDWELMPGNITYDATWGEGSMKSEEYKFIATETKKEKMLFTVTGTVVPGTRTDTLTFTAAIEPRE